MLRRNALLVVAAAIGLALAITSVASGFGEGIAAKGGARNPSPDARKAYTKETEIIADTSTYGTRQSNKSNNGGGAVYGCRSGEGGSAKGMEPCVRGVNLAKGSAFEFQSGGTLAGTINLLQGGDAGRPFTTNATGVATGLNADRVDSKSADDIVKDSVAAGQALNPLVQVTAGGAKGASRGVPDNGVSNPAGDGTYAVTFNGDLAACAMSATITGGDAGQVAVEPSVAADKKTTTVAVSTFSGAGTAADRGFHLSATC